MKMLGRFVTTYKIVEELQHFQLNCTKQFKAKSSNEVSFNTNNRTPGIDLTFKMYIFQ